MSMLQFLTLIHHLYYNMNTLYYKLYMNINTLYIEGITELSSTKDNIHKQYDYNIHSCAIINQPNVQPGSCDYALFI